MTRVALIAHDDEKPEMIDLVESYEETLAAFDLVGTGTTGQRIRDETSLQIERKESGPYGGDLQIGSTPWFSSVTPRPHSHTSRTSPRCCGSVT